MNKMLSEREHACPCGARMSRDLNAAINVLNLGVSAAGGAVVGSGGPPGRSPSR
jgi:transposase